MAIFHNPPRCHPAPLRCHSERPVLSAVEGSEESAFAGCRMRFLLPLFVAFLLSVSASVAQTKAFTGNDRELAERIVAILQRQDASQAHWGLEVVSLRDGERRFGWNQAKLFIPASTAK